MQLLIYHSDLQGCSCLYRRDIELIPLGMMMIMVMVNCILTIIHKMYKLDYVIDRGDYKHRELLCLVSNESNI